MKRNPNETDPKKLLKEYHNDSSKNKANFLMRYQSISNKQFIDALYNEYKGNIDKLDPKLEILIGNNYLDMFLLEDFFVGGNTKITDNQYKKIGEKAMNYYLKKFKLNKQKKERKEYLNYNKWKVDKKKGNINRFFALLMFFIVFYSIFTSTTIETLEKEGYIFFGIMILLSSLIVSIWLSDTNFSKERYVEYAKNYKSFCIKEKKEKLKMIKRQTKEKKKQEKLEKEFKRYDYK